MSSRQTVHVAFVAGATGYTGREVVRALRDHGIRTHAHVRPSSPRLEAWRRRFGELGAEVDATPWERRALMQTFQRLEPSLVFALLGTTRARAKKEAADGSDQPSYETVDYGLTAMLIAAACGVEPRPRFVFLSSAGLPEREPRHGNYMHARWRVEKELAETDLPYLCARPSVITGADRDDDRLGERVGGSVLDTALSVAGVFGMKRVRDRYRSTTNVVLANALVRVALDTSVTRCAVESEDLR